MVTNLINKFINIDFNYLDYKIVYFMVFVNTKAMNLNYFTYFEIKKIIMEHFDKTITSVISF